MGPTPTSTPSSWRSTTSTASTPTETPGAVIAALEAAKKTGEHAKFEVRDSEEDDDLYEYTIWYKGDNFGLGEGDGLNKYANVWLKVRPYEPDPAMRKRLEVLDREQLLAILLRTHAASYLSFPPDSAQS
jgi:hypothetical protein